jgi:RimJ/RimL family protein N-acetyltransferase
MADQQTLDHTDEDAPQAQAAHASSHSAGHVLADKALVEPATAQIPAPILTLTKCLLRPYTPSDAADLVHAADNPNVTRHMRNVFPNPYTLADAQYWIGVATERLPLRNFAIFRLNQTASGTTETTYAGGIGLKPLGDVEAHTMEIGYWLGEDHWGRGLATEALAGFSRWVFERDPALRRLEAGVFGGNPASARVLSKAGYRHEGTRRLAGYKDGVGYFDIVIYGLLREECLGDEEGASTGGVNGSSSSTQT